MVTCDSFKIIDNICIHTSIETIMYYRYYTKNLFLCLQADIISFLVLSKFPFIYFNIHIFSSKHKLHLLFKLFVEEDLLIIFQFITGTNSIRYH